MAKIDFFALGGLDEHGKDCYVLNINGDIFLINCGISAPPSVTLGIKKIIPDSNWIDQNKRAIKGIFIGTPNYDRFGALEFFHKYIPNTPIYVSNVGWTVLTTYFLKRAYAHNQAQIKLNLRILEPLKPERLGTTTITPFRISNSMPRSLGFIFQTPEGSIIYLDDFIISSNKNNIFEDELLEINKITNNKNLLLITGVGIVGQSRGFTNPQHRVSTYFDSILIDAPGRVIVACYDHDVYKVLGLLQVSSNKNRPINIYSNTFIELFKFLSKYGYFGNKKIMLIEDDKLDTSDNAVIIITGTPQRLFPKLSKIINDDDAKIHIKSNDTFIFAANTISGYETFEADIFDGIARSDINRIYKLPKNILPVSASNEDHKFLVEVLKPKYIIPVGGLYMDFVEYQKAVNQTGFDKKNVLIVENGKCVSFNNGILDNKTKFISMEQQYIGTQGVLDVGASSMFERDQMRDNGVVLLSIFFNKQQRVMKRFNYDQVGVINLNNENRVIFDAIVEQCNKDITTLITTSLASNALDMKEIKHTIRKIVDKQFEKKFHKKPLVLTTIIFEKGYSNVHKEN